MHGLYETKIAEAKEIERTLVQGTARLCSSRFGAHCKLEWPTKTAEQLAAAVGCSVRAAAYEISGERPPSDKSMLALINRIFAR